MSAPVAVAAAPRAAIFRFREEYKSVGLGFALLMVLSVAGELLVPGFLSAGNVRSMLLLAAFLGLASLGQSLVALVGGLDLSIPFVIGASNIGLAGLIGLGVPMALAVLIVVAAGMLVGALNAVLSFRLQQQALIVTLGVGFAVAGGTQIATSIGSAYSGNVFASIPPWFANLASINSAILGVPLPPAVLIWIGVTVLVIFALHRTRFGRELYAVGGSRTAAARLLISEFKVWLLTYSISGAMAALTGALLLGFSGGGFVGVGDPYLFTTVAAVVVGGTSLLGGRGGYGATVIGVLVLQVLISLLVGLGLGYPVQQAVFGLLIVPMVALYARVPHIRVQI